MKPKSDCRDCPVLEFYNNFTKMGITADDIIALEYCSKYLDDQISTIKKENLIKEKDK